MLYIKSKSSFNDEWNTNDTYGALEIVASRINSICMNNDGDIYLGSPYNNGGIFKKGTGDTSFSQLVLDTGINNIISTSTNDIYAIGYNNSTILKQTNSSGDFNLQTMQDVKSSTINITGIIECDNNIYITCESYDDDDSDYHYAEVWKQTNKIGSFVKIFETEKTGGCGISSDITGNIFIVFDSTTIYKKPYNSDTFSSYKTGLDHPYLLYCVGSNIYMIYLYSGSFFYLSKQTNQTGNFVDVYTDNDVLGFVYNSESDIYVNTGLYIFKQFGETGDFYLQGGGNLNCMYMDNTDSLIFSIYKTSTSSEIYRAT